MGEQGGAQLLTFEIEHTGNTAVVKCHGRLIADTSDAFYSSIKKLIPETPRIVLDLTDLSRMDSIGLGALVRLYVSARSSGSRLELINLGKQVSELLSMTHLLEVFAVIGVSGMRMG